MRDLGARSRVLAADARRYEHKLAELVHSLDDSLLDEPGVGPISAAKLLASDPARFKQRSALRSLHGTAPLPASSGKIVRHRLNRGCYRQVNNAIHTIALIRAKHQPETRATSTAASARGRYASAQAPHLPRPLQTARRRPLDFIEASLTIELPGCGTATFDSTPPSSARPPGSPSSQLSPRLTHSPPSRAWRAAASRVRKGSRVRGAGRAGARGPARSPSMRPSRTSSIIRRHRGPWKGRDSARAGSSAVRAADS
jgi:hypothetical protein